jgi:hypothetical protein
MDNKVNINKNKNEEIVLHDSDIVQDIVIERDAIREWLASLPEPKEPRWQNYLWQD